MPGAGHPPPYLAGRESETAEFDRLLQQSVILENMVLTGLRGVGKTVLLETFRPLCDRAGWRWAAADLSESTSVTEESIALRLITDIAVVTSTIVLARSERLDRIGFDAEPRAEQQGLDFATLRAVYDRTPGLVSDKLKAVLEIAAATLQADGARGLVFAYDEAQNLADHAAREQYPLSLLLDVFQSIQKRGIPFLLVLTGLPTLFPQLVEARTFAERMFRVVFLDRLDASASADAILKPIEDARCPVRFDHDSVEIVIRESGGYPYFIQFMCREIYDAFIGQVAARRTPSVPIDAIVRKLDTDFFAGRWARVTDRQRDLLAVIASLDTADDEFTVNEVVKASKQRLEKPFSASHVNQMLAALGNAGLVYKNRYGKYSFAVPLLGRFIRRQEHFDGS